MSRKREAVFMGLGILVGFALCGPAAQAANIALTAAPTNQTFYVNGQQVQFEAYEIHGNNFVKLRDIGKTVDFGVTYDGGTNTVHIDPGAPYIEEVVPSAPITPAVPPAPTAPSPSAHVTEADVRAVLEELEERYPSGTIYPTPYRSTSGGPYSSGMNCAGWATLCSDAAFGDLPWRRVERPSWSQIRPGDIVEYRNENAYHTVVVVERDGDSIFVTESGTHGMALWGGQYFQWWLESQPKYVLYTRYPS